MNNPGVQEGVAEEVTARLTKATQELQEKYAQGQGGVETSLEGPTGKAYQEKRAQELEAKKLKKEFANEQQVSSSGNEKKTKKNATEEDDLDEDEIEDDNELKALREQRLKQIRKEHNAKIENIAKGHGQFREILQDEFLAEVTSSMKVIVHFYHRDFPRCEIMDHHLQKLAVKHIECKFLKINAEKAPFFIEKLKIRTIPTVVLFNDGLAFEKILGFEGLSDGLPEGKEDEWPTIRLARILAEKGMIDKNNIHDEDEIAKEKALQMESMRRALLVESMAGIDDDDEEDFDDL